MRKAQVTRKTAETEITVELNIDGTGKTKIETPIGLLNHMLELFAFHGLFDLEIIAKGDSEKVDIHHTNEDIGIVLGKAFKEALGTKEGIRRNAFASWPMEDVTATVSVDISGRGFFKEILFPVNPTASIYEKKEYDGFCANHFFEAFAKNMGLNLNIQLTSHNFDIHTNLESIFKALGKAMDEATQIDPRRHGIPSTKGVID